MSATGVADICRHFLFDLNADLEFFSTHSSSLIVIVFSCIAIFSSLLQKSLYLMLIKSDCMLARHFVNSRPGIFLRTVSPYLARYCRVL